MAVLEGGVSGAIVGAGAEASSPLHVTRFPKAYGAGGIFRAGMLSGTIAAALAANSELFQFRYVTAASRIALVTKVEVSAAINLAATAAGFGALRMTAARAWTAAGSGGTRATLTTNNAKLRTSMATSEVNDMGIATTGALTAGTKTLDATDLSAVSFSILTGAITVAIDGNVLPWTKLFEADTEDGHPLVLANQEGFVIRSGVAMPATATWQLGVNVHWMEVPAY